MEKENVVNSAVILEESDACATSKRSNDDENIGFIPRKKLFHLQDDKTEKLGADAVDFHDKNLSGDESVKRPERVDLNSKISVFHDKSLTDEEIGLHKANSLEGNTQDSNNLTAVSVEQMNESHLNSTPAIFLSSQEKQLRECKEEESSASPILDPDTIIATHPISKSFEKNEIATPSSSELPLCDELAHALDESDPSVSLSQSICSKDSEEGLDPKIYKKKKKKKKKSNTQISKENVRPSKSGQPNYFVAVQVSNPKIHKAVVEIQETLLSSNEKFVPSLIDIATMHITLLVLHIGTEEELHTACSALDHCGASLSEDLSKVPVNLKFNGLSHFNHQTLFAKCVENDEYWRFLEAAGRVREIFSNMGVILPDEKDLVPHLTIAKLSKMPRVKGKPGIRKIDPGTYESHIDRDFGEQLVKGLQLLSMNKAKDSNRYYHSERESLFDVVPREALDHSHCCHPRQPVLSKLTQNERRRLHTDSAVSLSSDLPSISSSRGRPSSPSFPHRAIATTVVGGAVLLSLAFIVSRWMRRR